MGGSAGRNASRLLQFSCCKNKTEKPTKFQNFLLLEVLEKPPVIPLSLCHFAVKSITNASVD